MPAEQCKQNAWIVNKAGDSCMTSTSVIAMLISAACLPHADIGRLIIIAGCYHIAIAPRPVLARTPGCLQNKNTGNLL